MIRFEVFLDKNKIGFNNVDRVEDIERNMNRSDGLFLDMMVMMTTTHVHNLRFFQNLFLLKYI